MNIMNTRALARKTLKEHISLTALKLFTEKGYDKTAVKAIATEIGMSTLTVFRYFPAKYEVLMDHTHLFKASFLERFEERLTEEDIWEALKHSLIEFALNGPEPGGGAIQVFIRKTPALFSRQLEIFEGLLLEAKDKYILQCPEEKDFSWHTANTILRCGFSCLQCAQAGMPEKVQKEVFKAFMAQMKPAILIKT